MSSNQQQQGSSSGQSTSAENGDSATAAGPPADVTVVQEEPSDTGADLEKSKRLYQLICTEARSVSVWALVTPLVRFSLSPLIKEASWMLPSSGVAQDNAPGFVFASAWLLLALRDKFGCVPNVPLRICETVMGRLTLQDLCIILPVHFVCALSTLMILRLLLPSDMASLALEPIVYSTDSPWLVDCLREALINAAFTVAFLVLPVMLALNHVSRHWTCVMMYPLYSFGVDSNGKASTFGPNVLFALAACSQQQQHSLLGQTLWRFVGVMVGGFFGGVIMKRFFPDDPV